MALRFILDHAQDLTDRPGPVQDNALEPIAIGLNRSAVQTQKYYVDVEISKNPATGLLRD